MNDEQQENLNNILEDIQNGVFDNVGLVRPTAELRDNNVQEMLLPLSTGGNIRVRRILPNGEWTLAG